MNTLQSIFGTTEHLIWWQEGARAVVVLAYGIVLVRVAGRRLFGRWAPIDSIVAVLIGSNLSRTLTGNASLGGTLFATTLIVAVHWVLAHAVAHWPRFSHLLEGKAIPLARNGQPDNDTIARLAISAEDLGESLRKSGAEHMSETRLVMLESSGRITVVKPS